MNSLHPTRGRKQRPPAGLSIVVPTLDRDEVLVNTVLYLVDLDPRAEEILVVDQSRQHDDATQAALEGWERQGAIVWIHLAKPSTTHAMNVGLTRARSKIVLFVDDDIVPDPALAARHYVVHAEHEVAIVAGRVLQPWERERREIMADEPFRFSSTTNRETDEFMGGNFSVDRQFALKIGGFDEGFVGAAYRFERDFSDRVRRAGGRIWFEAEASLRHLRAVAGGTRSHGHHLRSMMPHHAVGEYYYLLGAYGRMDSLIQSSRRLARSLLTRHHLRHPWWIPATITAELGGFVWACLLRARGPRLLPRNGDGESQHLQVNESFETQRE